MTGVPLPTHVRCTGCWRIGAPRELENASIQVGHEKTLTWYITCLVVNNIPWDCTNWTAFIRHSCSTPILSGMDELIHFKFDTQTAHGNCHRYMFCQCIMIWRRHHLDRPELSILAGHRCSSQLSRHDWSDLWVWLARLLESGDVAADSTCLSCVVFSRVSTLAIAPLTWVRLVTSSALQSRKWQLIGMSQWCCSALCGHPLPALTDNWTGPAVQLADTSSPQSATLGLYNVAHNSWATTHFPSRRG